MSDIKSEADFDFSNVYSVVSEPEQYDAFMRSLLEKLDMLDTKESASKSHFLGAHWGKASILIDKVTPWRLETESELDKFLAAKMQPMIAFDGNGQVVGANPAARSLYHLGTKASLDDLPISQTERAALLNQIRRVVAGHQSRNNPNNVKHLENCLNGKPILITLERHCDDDDAGSPVAIMMTNDIYWPPYLGSVLQDLFKLTHAEIEVIRLMAQGARVAEIAEMRTASITTVRSQLRAIFAKTSTKSQLMHERDEGELIAARIQADVDTAHYPRADQRRIFKLSNGRQIDYSIFGAEKPENRRGTLLFFHDQALGDTWFKEAVTAATRAGIQIIAPLRPGFGRTTLYRGEAAVMSLRSGLVHGLAAARLMPDRFTSICAANPILPAKCDADLEGTNGYNLLIPKTRLHFPQALRFLCKAGFAFVTAKGPDTPRTHWRAASTPGARLRRQLWRYCLC